MSRATKIRDLEESACFSISETCLADFLLPWRRDVFPGVFSGLVAESAGVLIEKSCVETVFFKAASLHSESSFKTTRSELKTTVSSEKLSSWIQSKQK